MPDQDDFEPLARQRHPAFDSYLDSGSAEVVADEAIRVATAMLRCCGGFSIEVSRATQIDARPSKCNEERSSLFAAELCVAPRVS